MQQIFHEFMCSYTILKNFVDKRKCRYGVTYYSYVVIELKNRKETSKGKEL